MTNIIDLDSRRKAKRSPTRNEILAKSLELMKLVQAISDAGLSADELIDWNAMAHNMESL